MFQFILNSFLIIPSSEKKNETYSDVLVERMDMTPYMNRESITQKYNASPEKQETFDEPMDFEFDDSSSNSAEGKC